MIAAKSWVSFHAIRKMAHFKWASGCEEEVCLLMKYGEPPGEQEVQKEPNWSLDYVYPFSGLVGSDYPERKKAAMGTGVQRSQAVVALYNSDCTKSVQQ